MDVEAPPQPRAYGANDALGSTVIGDCQLLNFCRRGDRPHRSLGLYDAACPIATRCPSYLAGT